jgi:hypothetical protein
MVRHDPSRHERVLAAGCCFAISCLLGCSTSELPVYAARGRVTFRDGTAVGAGLVEARPVEAPRPVMARGDIQADGTFTLSTFKLGDGAIKGRHRAIVRPKISGHEGSEVTAVPIDARFGSYETSGLSFTVTENAAKNEFTLVVERPAK